MGSYKRLIPIDYFFSYRWVSRDIGFCIKLHSENL